MYSASPTFLPQREESIRFVTVIGVACRILALKLEWSTPADDTLQIPIRGWEQYISRTWDGWVMQFIRLIAGYFDDIIAPNSILRELTLTRPDAPDISLVALGGEHLLYENLTDLSDAFVNFITASEKSADDRRYWTMDVLRALILLLGDGVNFAFIEGAFSPALDMDVEEEAQTLLDAFEAGQPPLHDSAESDDDEDDTFMFHADGDDEDNDEDDDDDAPYFYFPATRRAGGLSHPEREVAKNIPIVSHRKAYSGHCNVQTVLTHCIVNHRLKMSTTTVSTMNTSCRAPMMESYSYVPSNSLR
jgi:hypothetical protein